MSVQEKLKELNIELPVPTTPGGSYASVNVRGNIAYIAIQFPIENGDYLFQGKLGEELTTADGYAAMRLCALNALSLVHHKVGFEHVIGLNHIDIYYQSVPNWDESPTVANGASELFNEVLGERGQHSRAILGVHDLPRNFSVGLTCSFTVQLN